MPYAELPRGPEIARQYRGELCRERCVPELTSHVLGETKRWQSNASALARSSQLLTKNGSQDSLRGLKFQAFQPWLQDERKRLIQRHGSPPDQGQQLIPLRGTGEARLQAATGARSAVNTKKGRLPLYPPLPSMCVDQQVVCRSASLRCSRLIE